MSCEDLNRDWEYEVRRVGHPITHKWRLDGEIRTTYLERFRGGIQGRHEFNLDIHVRASSSLWRDIGFYAFVVRPYPFETVIRITW